MASILCPFCGIEQVVVQDRCSSCGQSRGNAPEQSSVQELYAPPQTEVEAFVQIGDAEHLRRQHLNHEASIKSVGCLFLIGTVALPGGLLMLVGGLWGGEPWVIGVGFFYALFGYIYLWIGRNLRSFDIRARRPATFLLAIGLLGFPLGTLFSAYCLYLLHSAKGRMVFSPEYAEVRRQTPHIVYRTPIVVWAALIGFLAIITIAVIGIFAA